MKENEKQLNIILVKIANEIAITPAMIDKATQSYQAVGKWIGDGIDYDVQISPQGSMNLGTTIKPISDKDDYDIDLVCLLKNGQPLDAKSIKNIVGDRLKEHELYRSKIAEEGEGKRCWKMQYNEFHMDILPCVPKHFYIEPYFTDIRLTHKSESGYQDKFSNPFGYKLWFENQMKEILQQRKQEFAAQNRTDIKEVPTFRIKTPLQMSIQLLKRHRDMYFKDDVNDLKPISIIITTLAAKAYSGETSVYETLFNILNNMQNYIEVHDNVIWIPNPTMAEENFADKWEEYPQKGTAFLKWLQQARQDLITDPLNVKGLDKIKTLYSDSLGEAPVNRAFKAVGLETRHNRDRNHLYTTGLVGGLTTTKVTGSMPVKEHTFFG